jgi:hypothetical protein
MLNAVVCSRLHEPQEALSAATIAARDQRPQRARRGAPKAPGPAACRLDLILDQRGADMADLPGGASGLLVRGYKPDKALPASGPGHRAISRRSASGMGTNR